LHGEVIAQAPRPDAVSEKIRELACWMAQDLAARLALSREVTDRRYAAHLRECRDRIIFAMRQGTLLPALLCGPESTKVLGAIGADRVAFIRVEDVVTGGTTPCPRRILDIAIGVRDSGRDIDVPPHAVSARGRGGRGHRRVRVCRQEDRTRPRQQGSPARARERIRWRTRNWFYGFSPIVKG
jgi:hypothetical protein